MRSLKPALLIVSLFVLVETCLASSPRPRENKFMKMDAAGITTSRLSSGPALAYVFMFSLKQPIKMTRVRVDDLTNKPPVLLIDDRKPKVTNNQWQGVTQASSMTQSFPWMFDSSTTKKVFRITVFAEGQGEIVLKQPASYDAKTKKGMLQLTSMLKKSD
jgi:hypothetical protein